MIRGVRSAERHVLAVGDPEQSERLRRYLVANRQGLTLQHWEDLSVAKRYPADGPLQLLALGVRPRPMEPGEAETGAAADAQNGPIVARLCDLVHHGLLEVRDDALSVTTVGLEYLALPSALLIPSMPADARFALARAEMELRRGNGEACAKFTRETLELLSRRLTRRLFADPKPALDIMKVKSLNDVTAGAFANMLRRLIEGKEDLKAALLADYRQYLVTEGRAKNAARRMVEVLALGAEIANRSLHAVESPSHGDVASSGSGEALQRASTGLALARVIVSAAPAMFGVESMAADPGANTGHSDEAI